MTKFLENLLRDSILALFFISSILFHLRGLYDSRISLVNFWLDTLYICRVSISKYKNGFVSKMQTLPLELTEIGEMHAYLPLLRENPFGIYLSIQRILDSICSSLLLICFGLPFVRARFSICCLIPLLFSLLSSSSLSPAHHCLPFYLPFILPLPNLVFLAHHFQFLTHSIMGPRCHFLMSFAWYQLVCIW